LAELLNVTNATMYATGGSRESEIQMNMLRCGSNLAANYGLAIKEKAKVWEKEYFGESLSIPPEAQQFFDHHRNAPPLEAHVQVLNNYEVLTSTTDLLDPLELANPEVAKFLGVTQRQKQKFFFPLFFCCFIFVLLFLQKNTIFVVSPR